MLVTFLYSPATTNSTWIVLWLYKDVSQWQFKLMIYLDIDLLLCIFGFNYTNSLFFSFTEYICSAVCFGWLRLCAFLIRCSFLYETRLKWHFTFMDYLFTRMLQSSSKYTKQIILLICSLISDKWRIYQHKNIYVNISLSFLRFVNDDGDYRKKTWSANTYLIVLDYTLKNCCGHTMRLSRIERNE